MMITLEKVVGKNHCPMIPVDVKNSNEYFMRLIVEHFFRAANAEEMLGISGGTLRREFDAFFDDAIPFIFNSPYFPIADQALSQMQIFGANNSWVSAELKANSKKNSTSKTSICVNLYTPENEGRDLRYQFASRIIANSTYGISGAPGAKSQRRMIYIDHTTSDPSISYEMLRTNGIDLPYSFRSISTDLWSFAGKSGTKVKIRDVCNVANPLNDGKESVANVTVKIKDDGRFNVKIRFWATTDMTKDGKPYLYPTFDTSSRNDEETEV